MAKAFDGSEDVVGRSGQRNGRGSRCSVRWRLRVRRPGGMAQLKFGGPDGSKIGVAQNRVLSGLREHPNCCGYGRTKYNGREFRSMDSPEIFSASGAGGGIRTLTAKGTRIFVPAAAFAAFAMMRSLWSGLSLRLSSCLRRCPSSLYTFPEFFRAWLGIAISKVSPNLSSSASAVSRASTQFA